MRLTHTHTYAELDVSAATFAEIRARLVKAGYVSEDATELPMQGIMLLQRAVEPVFMDEAAARAPVDGEREEAARWFGEAARIDEEISECWGAPQADSSRRRASRYRLAETALRQAVAASAGGDVQQLAAEINVTMLALMEELRRTRQGHA